LEHRFSATLILPKLSVCKIEFSEPQLRPSLGWINLNTDLESLQGIGEVLLLSQCEIG
jgi:hypothetical protein